jgi:hypothetical protein
VTISDLRAQMHSACGVPGLGDLPQPRGHLRRSRLQCGIDRSGSGLRPAAFCADGKQFRIARQGAAAAIGFIDQPFDQMWGVELREGAAHADAAEQPLDVERVILPHTGHESDALGLDPVRRARDGVEATCEQRPLGESRTAIL